MGKAPPKWLPGERVDETILIQRKSVEELNADRLLRRDKLKEARQRHKDKIDMKRKKKLATKKFIPAQTILKHAQRKEHQAKKFYKVGEKFTTRSRIRSDDDKLEEYTKARVALVVRAKGNLIPTEVAAAFRRLGLRKIYSARLIVLNEDSHRLIRQLQSFSIVGFPTSQQLEGLIRTRGCFWNAQAKSKQFISGNLLVERVLGEHGILCVEDLTDAIINKTGNLREILSRIAPFDFHPPHQLFMERHRSAHQKLEIVNPESFAAYLQQQLGNSNSAKMGVAPESVSAAKKAKKTVASKKRKREEEEN